MKKPNSIPCTLFLLLMSGILLISSCNKEGDKVTTDAKEETPFTKDTKDLVKSDTTKTGSASMTK